MSDQELLKDIATWDSVSVQVFTDKVYEIQFADIIADALEIVSAYKRGMKLYNEDRVVAACKVLDAAHELMDRLEVLEVVKGV